MTIVHYIFLAVIKKILIVKNVNVLYFVLNIVIAPKMDNVNQINVKRNIEDAIAEIDVVQTEDVNVDAIRWSVTLCYVNAVLMKVQIFVLIHKF